MHFQLHVMDSLADILRSGMVSNVLSTPCNGFRRVVVGKLKRAKGLSTPCNGFYGVPVLGKAVLGKNFQLHVMDSRKDGSRGPRVHEHDRLSTPCNGFVEREQHVSSGCLHNFQLHVMDSWMEVRVSCPRWYLSTPCNGFRVRFEEWMGIENNFQLHVMDSRCCC